MGSGGNDEKISIPKITLSAIGEKQVHPVHKIP
jgi:hypothetical protein